MKEEIQATVRNALAEDVGDGDLTAALIDENAHARAWLIAKAHGVLCGTAWFEEAFHQCDPDTVIQWHAADGDAFEPGTELCEIRGRTRALLTAERTAMNFVQLLSGTATLTRVYAGKVEGTRARLLDTRKTLPGLRRAQKYAVRCGGGHNHRMGLHDGMLIKDNHVHAAGGVAAAVRLGRSRAPAGLAVEVEVERLDQLVEAIDAGADIVLLDNFTIDGMREAVRVNGGRVKLEASGNVDLSNIAEIAATGVDRISVGALTKNVEAVDLSLRFQRPTSD